MNFENIKLWFIVWCANVILCFIVYFFYNQQLLLEALENIKQWFRIWCANVILFCIVYFFCTQQLLLEAPDDIYTFKFCPTDPNIIVAGCINGQVVLWDISAYSDRLKTQRGGKKGKHNMNTLVRLSKIYSSTNDIYFWYYGEKIVKKGTPLMNWAKNWRVSFKIWCHP